MWNAAWLEDVKWSFDSAAIDASSPSDDPSLNDNKWHRFDKTNYADWTSSAANDADAEELYDAAASAVGNTYPPGYLLLRHFVDELEDDDADRMEFYVNHLSSECVEASHARSASASSSSHNEHQQQQQQEQQQQSERYDRTSRDEDDDDKYYYRPRLETVQEETDEDLARDRCDEYGALSLAGSDDSADATSSSSEQWKWGNGWLNTSDDDSSTVIDVPLGEFAHQTAPYHLSVTGSSYGFHEPAPFDVDFELSDADDAADADAEVPVKRRRTQDDAEPCDLSRAPSLTDSLAQFELLEKEINDADGDAAPPDDADAPVFRTSATSAPFEDFERARRDSDVVSVSSQVFFDCQEHADSPTTPIQLLETSSDGCSDVFVDPLEAADDEEWERDAFLHSDIEYDSDAEDNNDEEEATDRLQTLGFFSSRSHRMRSFRSYGDGLNRITDAEDALSNSNSSTSDRSSSMSPQDRSSPDDRSSPESVPVGPRLSAEALSEDSGYGDVVGSAPSSSASSSSSNGSSSQDAKKNNNEHPSSSSASASGGLLLGLPSGERQQAICVPDAAAAAAAAFPDAFHEQHQQQEKQESSSSSSSSSYVPLSAILVRRQPRTRSPLSFEEAEEFITIKEETVNNNDADDDGNGSGGGGNVSHSQGIDESRCGIGCSDTMAICIDLEAKRRTLDEVNADRSAATAAADANAPPVSDAGDDTARRPDLDASNFKRTGWVEEATTTQDRTDHRQPGSCYSNSNSDDDDGSGSGGSGVEPAAAAAAALGERARSPQSPPDVGRVESAYDDHRQQLTERPMDSAFYPQPVVLKRYGPRHEVEVYISSQKTDDDDDKLCTAASQLTDHRLVVPNTGVVRGVHFSPVVSAVNWRESYLDPSDDSDDSDRDSKTLADQRQLHQQHHRHQEECPNQPDLVPVAESASPEPPVPETPAPPGVPQVQPVETLAKSEPTRKESTAPPPDGAERKQSQQEPANNSGAACQAAPSHAKKPALFQRFSFSRLSARMSATFGGGRSETASAAGKSGGGGGISGTSSKKGADKTAEPQLPAVIETRTTTAGGAPPAATAAAPPPRAADKNGSKKSKGGKKMAPTEAPVEVKLDRKKIDEFKVAKEPKKKSAGGFFKQFYRSSSAPPAVKDQKASKADKATSKAATKQVTNKPDKADKVPESAAAGVGAASDVKPIAAAAPQEAPDVARQPDASCTTPEPLPPAPLERKAVQHAKPPLPPQVKAKSIAKKNYLVSDALPAAAAATPVPPSPVVSHSGLQVALQHFKESARMERERMANSVPDLAAGANPPLAQSTPTPPPRPFSDCIDRAPKEGGVEDARAPARSNLSALPPRPPASSSAASASSSLSRERARQAAISRANSVQDAWNATASRAALNLSRRNVASGALSPGSQGREPGKSRPVVGLLETDLDVPTCDETNLDELIQNLQRFCTLPASHGAVGAHNNSGVLGGGAATVNDKRFKSMLNLGCSSSAPASVEPHINETMTDANALSAVRGLPDPNRAKSMEFLLDEDNKSAVQVPENQLKKCSERQMSEHELRIQRSLQKLNVPDWYKKNARPVLSCAPSPTSLASPSVTDGPGSVTSTGILRRRDYGSSSLRSGTGWTGLSSYRNPVAASMTSLGSDVSRSATPTRVVIPTRVRPDWKGVKSSRESLNAPAEPNSLPAGSSGQPFSRWTSGRASYGACPSPAPSVASSTASSYRSTLLHQHGRTPYLGWRSQERLNASPAPLSVYQSPAERLASSLMSVKKADQPAATAATATVGVHDDEGVRSSIRQVTSAIVHYVTGDGASSSAASTPRPSRNGLSSSPERHPLEALSRSPSPRRQRCVWVESSFIGGSGGPDETAASDPPSSNSPVSYRADSPPPSHRLANNGRPVGLELADDDKREATLDDVLNSLLGLPTASKSPARSPLGPPPVRTPSQRHNDAVNVAATGS